MKKPGKIQLASTVIALAIKLCSFSLAMAENETPIKSIAQPAAAVEEFYTLKGKDPTLAELLQSGGIVTGDRMGKGPARGAQVVVNQARLEKLTGTLPPLDIKNITGIQHQAGHGGRSTFEKWSRFYQEEGNNQIFRLHKGDYQFRDPDPKTAIPGRIEAYTRSLTVPKGGWREWEGTYTFIKPHSACIFQMFHTGGLWAFHLGVTDDGTIRFNRRRSMKGKPKSVTLAEKMIGKPLSIKVRSNGFDFQVYKKRPLIDKDWELVADGNYDKSTDGKVQFRWGNYLGRTKGTSVRHDTLFFVSGTTIR